MRGCRVRTVCDAMRMHVHNSTSVGAIGVVCGILNHNDEHTVSAENTGNYCAYDE